MIRDLLEGEKLREGHPTTKSVSMRPQLVEQTPANE